MKALLILTTACGLVGAQETSKDIRVVNGVSVDVAPVRQWFKNRRGERPMQHWKQLQVIEMKSRMANWDRCVVKTEAGAKAEVFLANLPKEVGAFFRSVDQQYQAIAKLRAQIETNTRLQREANAVTPRGAIGSVEYVEAVMKQRRQVNLWRAKIETAKEELAKMEAAYNATLDRNTEVTTIIAMFTGQKYAGLDVWDCGAKR